MKLKDLVTNGEYLSMQVATIVNGAQIVITTGGHAIRTMNNVFLPSAILQLDSDFEPQEPYHNGKQMERRLVAVIGKTTVTVWQKLELDGDKT